MYQAGVRTRHNMFGQLHFTNDGSICTDAYTITRYEAVCCMNRDTIYFSAYQGQVGLPAKAWSLLMRPLSGSNTVNPPTIPDVQGISQLANT